MASRPLPRGERGHWSLRLAGMTAGVAGNGWTRPVAAPIKRPRRPRPPPMRTADWLLLAFLSLLWGASFFFAAVAVRDIPPLTLVLARVAIAALILLPIVRALGLALPSGFAAWRAYAVLAVLNNLVPFSLIFYGQTRIASAL